MQTFTVHTGLAAPLLLEHVDTDMIIPKQFLKTIHRTGLGKHLFHDLRFREDGTEVPDFVLNQPAFRSASILLAGGNFGCGSSREHAPWALADFGIRCVIAPSFADIFYNNCFQNGLLPLVLDRDRIADLAAIPAPLTVDLVRQEVRVEGLGDGLVEPFAIDPGRRTVLLEGLDDIRRTEQRGPSIAAFEAFQRRRQPWLYRAPSQG